MPVFMSRRAARAGAVASVLTGAAAITAAAGRYPLEQSSPINAASARAPITALYAILIAAGILFLTGLVVVMWPRRRRPGDEEPPFLSEPSQMHWLGRLLAVLLPLALAAALIAAVLTGAHAVRATPRSPSGAVRALPVGSGPLVPPPPKARGFVLPGWLPWSVLGILLVGVVAGLFLVWNRRGPSALEHADERDVAAGAVDAALTALDTETEPRTAVIAAYAAMQETLAAEGVARRGTEAPREYLHRVLLAGTATQGEAGALTALFEEARFSAHPISRQMQDAATRTLSSLRARLVAARAS
jgi:phosphatidylglycerophosphate synthase